MKKIKNALISVFHKEGLDEIVKQLDELGIRIYSTGGTQQYIEQSGIPVISVESLTDYPSILDGRVKTLHPKVFGGILARREAGHLAELESYNIPLFDLVIVDLYPFEKTVVESDDEQKIIEKIDIGGISLIRAAAKNYRDVAVVPSMEDYDFLLQLLREGKGESSLAQRRHLAARAFAVSSHYDSAIFNWISRGTDVSELRMSYRPRLPLRYGENPHQKAEFYGRLEDAFTQLNGKALSYNNLVDIDAAIQLMAELKDGDPAFVVMKHTNACGVAVRSTVREAWKAALAGDPISAFGGILISNRTIDLGTAEDIDKIFYEVLIAPDFEEEALAFLRKKSKRILLQLKDYSGNPRLAKSLLNGAIVQDADRFSESKSGLKTVTKVSPSEREIKDLLFANTCVKHLKSNAIALIKNGQLLGMGCGQTSRVDACRQAIEKAGRMGLELEGAVMASDAFFPFPDSIELAHRAGITSVIQPGGSIKDALSIDYCDAHGLSMVFTGHRHFKH